MDYDNYLSEYDEDLKAGDILVYDNGVGGNASYHFLKIVSFVKNSTTPHVVPLVSVATEENRDILTDTYTSKVTPGLPTRAVAQHVNKTKNGFFTWKKDCLRPCFLELYNPEKEYRCIHHYN